MTAKATPSEQMINLLARYHVKTEMALLDAIRHEQAEETGETMTRQVAAVVLDRMLEAEYQRIEGGAYVDAEPIDPETQALLDETDAVLVDRGRLTLAGAEYLLGEPSPSTEERTTMNANTTNPIDDLPDGTTDPRQDPRLNDTAFLATDEGQQLLESAAKADAESRKAAKLAEMKAKAEEAAKRKAEIDAAHKPGPVEIVKPATNGKPSKAAVKAATKATPTKVVKPTKERASAKATNAARAAKVTNHPMVLGTKPIDVGGVKQAPILGKDGKALERYQSDNWIWRCTTCGARVRAATCDGTKVGAPHASVAAPHGYRRESRVVAEAKPAKAAKLVAVE